MEKQTIVASNLIEGDHTEKVSSLLVCFLTEMKPEKNRLVNIIPVHKQTWQLSLEVIVFSQYTGQYYGIFQMVATRHNNNSSNNNEDKVLLEIMVDKSSQSFLIRHHDNSTHTLAFQFNRWTKITIMQLKLSDGRYIAITFVDEAEAGRIVFEKPKDEVSMKCLLTKRDGLTMNGLVKNLKYFQGKM